MGKAEEEPDSITALGGQSEERISLLEVDLVSDSHSWNTLDCDIGTFIKRVAATVAEHLELWRLGNTLTVAVLLSDDQKLQELNRTYRDKDSPTNVLAFPSYDLKPYNYIDVLSGEKDIHLGDVALSYSTIYYEAVEQDKAFIDHIAHMIVHSLLHLFGYDHEDDLQAAEMEAMEVEILAKLGISNPYQQPIAARA